MLVQFLLAFPLHVVQASEAEYAYSILFPK